ncbi:MAG: hypothetical protein DHS20C21_01730 [Gemmatimonadota bacterium]|nr:MAG: hypothetical protein DHS20C21_01730 [Gemmatimonadota bacterium]
MAKRFAYVSFGILSLVAAYQLGTVRASADWSGVGQIVGASGSFAYDSGGRIWRVGTDGWERWSPDLDLPVSPSEIKLLTKAGGLTEANVLITKDDELWAFHGYDNEWKYVGPFPGGPVSIDKQSWGATKGSFR